MLGGDYGEGARIVIVSPGSTPQVLTGGFHSASDPDISFDGRRILFAGKQKAEDAWNIFEVNVDGSGLRQITRDLGDCRQPIYQSRLNTLVAEQPWYQITFVSTAAGELNESAPVPSTSLYSCRLDGSLVTRLTFNPSSDLDPFLMEDGRILFASWQRSRLDRGFAGRVGLFGVNLDGADFALYAADQGRRIKRMPCATTDGLVIFVEAEELGWDGAGCLAAVSMRRPLYTYRQLTRPEDGLFHSPSPLPGGAILVSRRASDGSGTFGVVVLDPETQQSRVVFDDPDYHDIQAKLLAARPEPDGRSTSVFVATGDIDEPSARESFIPSNPLGKLYCLNAYISDVGNPHWVAPGVIKRLRVLEGIPRYAEDAQSYLAEGVRMGISGPGSSEQGIPALLPRRFLGEIPVEPDGSFNIQVPADIPLELQLLDADGMALRTCGWIWVKNNEPRGCIGCHEDPELVPENRMVDAVKRASVPLTLPPERRRVVDFRRDIMPIIERKCVACHGPGTTFRLDGGLELIDHGGKAYFNRAYESLLAAHETTDAAPSPYGKYVHPGRARTSPLIWSLFGRNTSRAWDGPEAKGTMKVNAMPPSGAPALTEDERRTFVEWIDTGALWDGIPKTHKSSVRETGR